MKGSKLIEILKTFSKEEMNSFGKFIISPYFRTKRNTLSLFKAIAKFYPHFDSNELNKKNIYSVIYPGQKFNEKSLKNLNYDLTKLAEEFLIMQSLGKKPFDKEKYLSIELRDRRLDKMFLHNINNIESVLANRAVNAIEYFFNKEKLEELKSDYYLHRNKFEKGIESKLNRSEALGISFLMNYLRIRKELLVAGQVYNIHLENDFLDSLYENFNIEKLLDKLKTSKNELYPLISILYSIFNMTKNPGDEKYYYEAKKLILNHAKKLLPDDRFYFYCDLATYCIDKMNSNEEKFSRELSGLYKLMLRNGLYKESNAQYMQVAFYRNIFFTFLNLKDYGFVESFIKDFSIKLNPEFIDNMKYLSNAELFFHKKDFEKALENIIRVEYEFFLYKVDVKNLMLKIYYEMNLFEQSLSLVDAYQHYLSKTKDISKDFKLLYKNFLNYYKKILKLKMNNDDAEIYLIKQKLKPEEPIYSKEWLMEKIIELETKIESR